MEMKLAQKYIHHRNLLVRGQLELGVIMSLVNTGILGSVFLKIFFDIPAKSIAYIIIGCVLLTALLQYLFGWIYEKKRMFDKENSWLTDRTPVFRFIFQELMLLRMLLIGKLIRK